MKRARLLLLVALTLVVLAAGSTPAPEAMPVCTLTNCTQAHTQCAQSCVNQGCKVGSFVCDSGNPCGYECMCTHCIP